MTDPILIAGAGPTGLTAALELSRIGVAVRLIDKRDAPATTSRATGVQARTLELFEQRGLADEMVRLGNTSTVRQRLRWRQARVPLRLQPCREPLPILAVHLTGGDRAHPARSRRLARASRPSGIPNWSASGRTRFRTTPRLPRLSCELADGRLQRVAGTLADQRRGCA